MGDTRVKEIYRDERLLNEFLALKDIELVNVKVSPMNYIVF